MVVLNNSLANLATKVCYVFFAASINFIITNYYGVEAFGYYSITMTYISTFMLLCAFGLDYGVIKSNVDRKEVRRCMSIICILSVLFFPVLIIFCNLFDINYFASIVVVFFAINLFRHGVYVSEGYVVKSFIFDNIYRPLIIFLLLVLNVYFFKIDFEIAITIALFLSSLIFIPSLLKIYRTLSKEQDAFSLKLRYTLRSNLIYLMIALLTTMIFQLDRFLVERLTGLRLLGLYAISQYFVTMMDFISQSFVASILPRVAKKFNTEKKQVVDHCVKTSMCIFFLSCTFFFIGIICFPEILPLLGVESSKDVNLVIDCYMILSVFYIASYAFGMSASVISFSEYRNNLVLFLFISLIISVTMNILLIPTYGLIGAAFGTGTGIFIYKLLCFLLVFKRFDVNISIFRKILKYD